MTASVDKFRDYGLIPPAATAPRGIVRASFSRGQIIGQYIATGLMTAVGLGMSLLFLLLAAFPANLAMSVLTLVAFGYLIARVTRNDYAWIELSGLTLRAKHLYTGRIVERSIEEIDDLLTMVFQVRTLALRLTEAWTGRVRGILIRFHDQRTPLTVSRVDPAMTHAVELMSAIVYRLAESETVEVEMRERDGQPLVHRLYRRRD